jgi:hypothetical protein
MTMGVPNQSMGNRARGANIKTASIAWNTIVNWSGKKHGIGFGIG